MKFNLLPAIEQDIQNLIRMFLRIDANRVDYDLIDWSFEGFKTSIAFIPEILYKSDIIRDRNGMIIVNESNTAEIWIKCVVTLYKHTTFTANPDVTEIVAVEEKDENIVDGFIEELKSQFKKFTIKPFFDEDAYRSYFIKPVFNECWQTGFFLNPHYPDGYWENHVIDCIKP